MKYFRPTLIPEVHFMNIKQDNKLSHSMFLSFAATKRREQRKITAALLKHTAVFDAHS
jgi:hypothetical protein